MSSAAVISWLLRGSNWRRAHLLQCDDHTCYKQFKRGAPGSINASSHTDDEAEQLLNFHGFTTLTRCPACAAPLWRAAVENAIHQQHWR
jgi:uncharacterized protein with PIN domain